jgi:ferrous iron transport protein A
MDAAATPAGIALAHHGLSPGYVSLSALAPGSSGLVVGVGKPSGSGQPDGTVSPLERRLLELGFISGEQFEIVAEAWPGHDPFVVRIGSTTLALRRREAESIWVELTRAEAAPTAPAQVATSTR